MFGSAAMALIKHHKFPPWALFAYKDLKEAASGPPPQNLAYIGKDILVLAPQIENKTMYGMVIAQESASGSLRLLESLDGERVFIYVPEFSGKFYCEENVGSLIAFHVENE